MVSNAFIEPDQILSQSVHFLKLFRGPVMRKKCSASGIACLRVITGSLLASLCLLKSHFLTPDLLPNAVLCYKSTEFFNKQNKCTHQERSEFVLAIYFIHITKRFADHLFKAACIWISTPGMSKPG